VLAGTSKVGGILVESELGDAGLRHVVVGIGLNVNHADGEVPENATSLRIETGSLVDREPLVVALLIALERRLAELAEPEAGLGATRHGWRWQVPDLFASPGEAAALGFCDSLAGDLRVAVFDNRGAGRSARAAGPRSIAQMGDDAVAVGEAALGAPFHLVGVSMGGMVALDVVLRHPSEVTTLTLLCTSAGGTALTPPRQEVLDAWANVNGLDEKALGWENAVLGYSDRFVTERRDVVEHCMEFGLA